MPVLCLHPPILPHQSWGQQHWPRGSACACRDSAHQHDIDCAVVSEESVGMCVECVFGSHIRNLHFYKILILHRTFLLEEGF